MFKKKQSDTAKAESNLAKFYEKEENKSINPQNEMYPNKRMQKTSNTGNEYDYAWYECYGWDCWNHLPPLSDCCICNRSCCTVLIALTIFIVFIVLLINALQDASLELESANEYTKYSTTEQCLIMDSKTEECQLCDQNTRRNRNRDCTGYRSQYIAIISDECDNSTLISDFTLCEEKATHIIYVTNTKQTCYFLDCMDEEFTFTKPAELQEQATISVIVFSIIVGIFGLVLIVAMICCIRKLCK